METSLDLHSFFQKKIYNFWPLMLLSGYLTRDKTFDNRYRIPNKEVAQQIYIRLWKLWFIKKYPCINMNDLFNWLLDLNSIVMPMRYLWVFIAYMAIKKLAANYNAEYNFVRNPLIGMGIGFWCFALTAFAIIMGMFPKGVTLYTSQWYFQLTLNIITPFALLGLGFIMPYLAKRFNTPGETNERD